MATVVRETERKYDPAAGEAAALDAVKTMTGTAGVAAVPELPEQLLDAIYYDTADLRFYPCGHHAAAAHGRRGCGLAPETARGRGHPGRDTPAADRRRWRGTGRARSFGQGLYPGAALALVVRIQTRRHVLRLLDGAGRALAEIAADHVSAEPADGSTATAWDEIEAELVTGGPALLTAIDQQLRRAGRPDRRHHDQTAAGAGGPAARRRAHSGTATDQAFARRRGRARLPARPGGRHLTL